MKPISRLVGVLALAAVLPPAVLGGDTKIQPARYVPQPTYTPSTSSPSGLPMTAATPSKPYVVRPVYVVSVGATSGSATTAVRAARNVELTQELVSILNETKSVDVLLMTMETLAELKAEPRLVIPAIIRNCERLNLLDGICTPETRNSDQKKILELLEFFTRRTRMVARSKKAEAPTTSCTPGATTPTGTYWLPPKSGLQPLKPIVTPTSTLVPQPQPKPQNTTPPNSHPF